MQYFESRKWKVENSLRACVEAALCQIAQYQYSLNLIRWGLQAELLQTVRPGHFSSFPRLCHVAADLWTSHGASALACPPIHSRIGMPRLLSQYLTHPINPFLPLPFDCLAL